MTGIVGSLLVAGPWKYWQPCATHARE